MPQMTSNTNVRHRGKNTQITQSSAHLPTKYYILVQEKNGNNLNIYLRLLIWGFRSKLKSERLSLFPEMCLNYILRKNMID